MQKYIWILEKLGRYKYLTVSQFQTLHYEFSKKTLYKNLRLLREKNLIDKTSYKYSPLKGRLEDIYYLKPRGHTYLLKYGSEEYDVKLNKKQTKGFFEDYDHRKKTIYCQIQFDLMCGNLGLERFKFYQYFNTQNRATRKHRQRATKIHLGETFVIPDSVIINSNKKKATLFCLEVHNGYRYTRLEKQMKKYSLVLASGAASEEFKTESNPYILVVFENQSTRLFALEQLSTDSYFLYLKKYYLFKTISDLHKNPFDHRINLDKEKISLLDL